MVEPSSFILHDYFVQLRAKLKFEGNLATPFSRQKPLKLEKKQYDYLQIKILSSCQVSFISVKYIKSCLKMITF